MNPQTAMDKKKIMIVEDDPDILEVFKLMLRQRGYEVILLPNNEDLKKYLGADLPDIVLLDLRISGRDGREICRQIKEHPATQRIPVILISADVDLKSIAHECGADDFIAKPFTTRELFKTMEKHLLKVHS
jgi:DNA-binding response OmpR family regulator